MGRACNGLALSIMPAFLVAAQSTGARRASDGPTRLKRKGALARFLWTLPGRKLFANFGIFAREFSPLNGFILRWSAGALAVPQKPFVLRR
jgi:hypothetical protein